MGEGKKLGRYEKKVMKELFGSLETLLRKTVANRGTEHAFIAMGDYRYIPWEWIRAEQALEKAARFYGDDLGVQDRKIRCVVLDKRLDSPKKGHHDVAD